MKTPSYFVLSAALVAALGTFGSAQIERLDLETMAQRVDNAVYAEIVGRHIFSVDHPTDGPDNYFTTLTLRGESLMDNNPIQVDVTFAGGWDPETGTGVYNSEAPSPDDVRIGNKIIAFYKWQPNMGADVAANSLYAAHGGLYRTALAGENVVVMGRGEGYAVEQNTTVKNLRVALADAIGKSQKND